MTTKIRGILFDFDGTLGDSWGAHDRNWEEIEAVLHRHVPHADLDELQRRYLDLGDRHYEVMLRDDLEYDVFRRNRLAETLEPWQTLDDELFAEYVEVHNRTIDAISPFPDAVDTLRSLRAQGIKVGVLTNGPSALQRRKLKAAGLEAEFDAIAVSQELRAAKPAREAFERALELLGTRAEETAMVGDDLENDVAGALAAGLGAVVWVERRPGDLPDGAYLARQIADVPKILGLDG